MLWKYTREPMLLEVRKAGMYRIDDCKDKVLYKHLRIDETENWWIKKRMHGQLHRDIEDKIDWKKDIYGWLKVI